MREIKIETRFEYMAQATDIFRGRFFYPVDEKFKTSTAHYINSPFRFDGALQT